VRVLLVDVDALGSRNTLPNLALMKLSSFHKGLGDEVFLNDFSVAPDKVYISCIFTWNRGRALGLASLYRAMGCEVEVGGTGIDVDKKLPAEVEHMCPDYSLYRMDYSMGFVTRGCIRRCPWCIVPRKEGWIRFNAPLSEFVRHRKIVLLDGNLLAYDGHREILIELMARRALVNFNQGLDIRLVTRDNAKLLSRVRYSNWRFTDRVLHFAFDLHEVEDEVRRGVELLRRYGVPRGNMMFYMLVGFNTTFEEDMRRFEVLRELGVDPFVMLYQPPSGQIEHPKKLRDFARWVNKRIYKKVPFSSYDPRYSFKRWRKKSARINP